MRGFDAGTPEVVVAPPALSAERGCLGQRERAPLGSVGLLAPLVEVVSVAEQVGVGAELLAQVGAWCGR
jgi:hypothetical protein